MPFDGLAMVPDELEEEVARSAGVGVRVGTRGAEDEAPRALPRGRLTDGAEVSSGESDRLRLIPVCIGQIGYNNDRSAKCYMQRLYRCEGYSSTV